MERIAKDVVEPHELLRIPANRLSRYLIPYGLLVIGCFGVSLVHAITSEDVTGLDGAIYHMASRTAAAGTALAAVIVGLEGGIMGGYRAYVKKVREQTLQEGREKQDKVWRDWFQQVKPETSVPPPPPPSADDEQGRTPAP